MKLNGELDTYFLNLANQAKNSTPRRVTHHEKRQTEQVENDKRAKKVVMALFVIGSLALGFGIAYTNTQNRMIEERGGTVNYVYNQEKTVVDLNGAEKPTVPEVIDEMFGIKR